MAKRAPHSSSTSAIRSADNTPVPGFHPEGKYEFKVDLNGDAVEELTYRVTFGERDSAGIQRYEVRRLTDPESAGTVIAEGATESAVVGASGVRVWAGRAGDPFWIEPDVLHAVGHAVQDGTTIDLSGWDSGRATNLFAGHTVYSLVVELPDSEFIQAADDGRIGVWAVASLATDAGGWRSINRIGLPMIHPLFTQFNEDLGDQLNAGSPSEDFETYGELVTKEVAGVVAAYGTAEDPVEYARGQSRTGSCRTSFPTKSERRRCSASEAGTDAR